MKTFVVCVDRQSPKEKRTCWDLVEHMGQDRGSFSRTFEEFRGILTSTPECDGGGLGPRRRRRKMDGTEEGRP